MNEAIENKSFPKTFVKRVPVSVQYFSCRQLVGLFLFQALKLKIQTSLKVVKKSSFFIILFFSALNLLAEPLLATKANEYLILKNGSVIQAEITKLDRSKGLLAFTRLGAEHTASLEHVQAISFQGSYYPPVDTPIGFYLSSGQNYSGVPSYITSTMIGRAKPNKMRFKKNAMKFLVLNEAIQSQSFVKVYGKTREVIYGDSFSESDKKLSIQTPIGVLSLAKQQVLKVEDLSQKTLIEKSHVHSTSVLPFLSSVKDPQFNQSFTGKSIRVSGFPCRHFITLHTKTELSLKVPEKTKYFTAQALIDPHAVNGDLNLVISQNNQEIYKNRIHSGQTLQEINLEVKEGLLKISADFGVRGSAGDFLILANPQMSGIKQ